MTLLTIAQTIADEIGLPDPVTVAGNTDRQARQLLSSINREGQNLARRRNTWNGGWTVLELEHVFTTTNGQDEYNLPNGFGELLGGTVWDRANFFQVRGPLTPSEWQAIKSGLSASPAIRNRYRIKRIATGASGLRKFVIDPVPDADGETFVFEYLTKNWVSNAAGNAFTASFQNDDDVALLDEDLIEMGAKWRFKKDRGLDFTADLAEYEIERDSRMANDTGTTDLFTARNRFRLPSANTPETGFGPQ